MIIFQYFNINHISWNLILAPQCPKVPQYTLLISGKDARPEQRWRQRMRSAIGPNVVERWSLKLSGSFNLQIVNYLKSHLCWYCSNDANLFNLIQLIKYHFINQLESISSVISHTSKWSIRGIGWFREDFREQSYCYLVWWVRKQKQSHDHLGSKGIVFGGSQMRIYNKHQKST